MKKLFNLSLLAIAAAAVVWFTREHLLPAPKVADEPKPPFRSTPPPPQAEPDDLTEIKGIGPVFAGRLHDAGIRSFRGLSELDAATLASSAGTTESTAAGWIEQAKAYLS